MLGWIKKRWKGSEKKEEKIGGKFRFLVFSLVLPSLIALLWASLSLAADLRVVGSSIIACVFMISKNDKGREGKGMRDEGNSNGIRKIVFKSYINRRGMIRNMVLMFSLLIFSLLFVYFTSADLVFNSKTGNINFDGLGWLVKNAFASIIPVTHMMGLLSLRLKRKGRKLGKREKEREKKSRGKEKRIEEKSRGREKRIGEKSRGKEKRIEEKNRGRNIISKKDNIILEEDYKSWREELEIMNVFRRNIFEEDSIRGIMKKAHKKSYGRVFESIQRLVNKKILNPKKKGRSMLCSINLDNELSLAYLSFLDSIEANSGIGEKVKMNVRELINSLPMDYFTFIVTGSYAKGKATKKSDLDVVVIVEDGVNLKRVLNILKNKSELMILEIHPYIFTKSEFSNMLISDEMNYGKLIFKNRLIFYGAQNFYRIIRGAIKNGFRG